MEGRTLDRIGLFVALGGAALTLIAFVLGDASLGFGALVGSVTALSNWLAVRWLGKQIIKANDRGKMFWGTVLAAKMALMLGVVWLILSTGVVSPPGFAIGMGALLIGALAGAWLGMGKTTTSEEH
jgi:hypothetical protein